MSMIRLTILLGILSGPAQAQYCLGRPDFDACMMQLNQANIDRTAQAQRQIYDQYVAENQGWLRENYAAHLRSGGRMTPQQFAYWGLMTANGTNVQGAVQAQRDQFEGQQRAHRTITEGNDSYNRGSAANSRAMSDTANRYNQGAIRGNTAVVDPTSGETRYLPYGAPPGQPFMSGGETYVRNQYGTFFQQRGNSWMPMNPGR